MEDLFFDICIGAVALTGLLVGLLLARKLVSTRLRSRDNVFKGQVTWALTLCVGFMSGFLYWQHIRPWYYIAAVKECQQGGDPSPQWAEDCLVHMGSQAVGPILESVHGYDVFERGTCLLPAVLTRIGAPAHQALLTSIDQEKNPTERIGLIYTLQEAFHDNSRLPLWIDFALSQNKTDPFLWNSVAHAYPDAPFMPDEQDGINPAFAVWYQKRNPK